MTAIRSVRTAEGKFVQISNAAMQDCRLSFTARGILAYVLSLPPDHYLTSEWLEGQASESRRVMRTALRELETCGYYRKTKMSGGRGAWVWEHVMSDAPLVAGDEVQDAGQQASELAFPQVVSSDHLTADVNTPDVNRSDKEPNTQTPNTEEMVLGRASRRAHASSARVTRTVDQVIADVREAVANVHGQQEADGLSDDEVLGLYATYANPRSGPPRDLVAYLAKVLGDAPYLDTFMSNVEPVCRECQRWESDCRCPAAA